VLVQEDFDAIGRMNGGQEPAPVSAADCKNPYVDGQIPLPGSPIVQGVVGGGVTSGGATSGGGATSTTGAGGSSASGASSSSGSGGSRAVGATSAAGSGGTAALADGLTSSEAAAGLTPQLAAEGYTVVNGQIVRKLGVGGPNEYQRADTLVAATDDVASPQVGMYVGWALLVLGIILLPPGIAMRRSRRRAAVSAEAGLGTPTGGAADR
jgi:hypothetical protein